MNDFPKLAEIERALVITALSLAHGNRGDAARLLGVNRKTVFNFVHRYKLVEFYGPKRALKGQNKTDYFGRPIGMAR